MKDSNIEQADSNVELRVPIVLQRIAETKDRVECLNNLILNLRDRLKNVLSSPFPTEKLDKENKHVDVPLANEIENITVTICENIQIIEDIMNRLEV